MKSSVAQDSTPCLNFKTEGKLFSHPLLYYLLYATISHWRAVLIYTTEKKLDLRYDSVCRCSAWLKQKEGGKAPLFSVFFRPL